MILEIMMEYKSSFRTLNAGVAYVEKTLELLRVPKAKVMQAATNADHAIWHIMESLDKEGDSYTVIIKKTAFFTDITIEATGNRVLFDEEEVAAEDRNPSELLYKSRYHEAFTYKRVKRTNRISYVVNESETKELADALIAMIVGIAAGLVIRLLCSENLASKIDYYVFSLVMKIFMNTLKVIVGPVVFFSLACCVSRFKNLKILGRIAVKTMGFYFCTTLVAIGIGLGLYSVFPVGNTSIATYIQSGLQDEEAREEYDEMIENYEQADFSIRSIIESIAPDNFIKAFLEMNLLQLIFLALLVGVGIGRCGDYGEFLTNLVEGINQLLMVLTTIITKFIPVAIFCAMAELVITVGVDALFTILSFAALVIAGMLLMMIFYGLFILVFAKVNPLIFYKKFAKAMMTAFVTSSAIATMPTTLKCCNDMGIDDDISSFSIPLGANINMDGSSMVFIMVVLFMSKIFGVSMNGTMLLTTIISIVFLALGSPSVAGADLVIIAVLLNQVGIPIEAIGLILGADAVFDMVQAMSNTTGDAAVTLVVAKLEKKLDRVTYIE